MTTELRISKELALPIDVAGQTIGLVGIRGSGKTNTAGVIAEELLDQNHPVVVIDPTDAWWGLRSGYPVFIFGGTHGDIPLQDTDGRVIAEFVVKEQVPLILSLRHLRKNAQRRLVTDFCEELYHLKGQDQYRTPLTVFIDEAPLFVPQKVLGELARTVGAVEDLIARGRSSGFGVVLISQRSATINKDVLTQADTIITHRLTGPQDRKALQEWIEENASLAAQKEVLSSLATMPNGRAWVWAPRLDVMKQVQIRLRRTFDSSASPKIGERLAPPKKLTEIDLELLKGRLAEAVKEAQENDPKALRAEIARLKRELLENRPAPGTDPLELDKARAAGKIDGYTEACRDMHETVQPMKVTLSVLQHAVSQLNFAFERLEAWEKREPRMTAVRQVSDSRLTNPPPVKHSEQFADQSKFASSDAGSGAKRRMMIALAQNPGGLSHRKLAILSDVKRGGSTWRAAMAALRRDHQIDESGEHVALNSAGIRALGEYEPLPTGAALRAYWRSKMGNATRLAVFDAIISAYPRAISAAHVARYANVEPGGSTWRSHMAYLRGLELVSGSTELRASEELFD